MRKWLISAQLLLLLTGCAGRSGNLIFINDSSFPVGLVELTGPGYSQGGCYADGSPIERGDTFDVQMDPDDGERVILRVYQDDGRTVLAERELSLSFAGGRTYTVTLSESRNGAPLLLLQEQA